MFLPRKPIAAVREYSVVAEEESDEDEDDDDDDEEEEEEQEDEEGSGEERGCSMVEMICQDDVDGKSGGLRKMRINSSHNRGNYKSYRVSVVLGLRIS